MSCCKLEQTSEPTIEKTKTRLVSSGSSKNSPPEFVRRIVSGSQRSSSTPMCDKSSCLKRRRQEQSVVKAASLKQPQNHHRNIELPVPKQLKTRMIRVFAIFLLLLALSEAFVGHRPIDMTARAVTRKSNQELHLVDPLSFVAILALGLAGAYNSEVLDGTVSADGTLISAPVPVPTMVQQATQTVSTKKQRNLAKVVMIEEYATGPVVPQD